MTKRLRKAWREHRRMFKWLILAPVLLVLAVQLYYLARIVWWIDHNPSMTAMMSAQQAVLREKNPKAKLRHTWVPYERISVHLKRAVVASEDANFAEHYGVDWEAMQHAYEKNSRRRKIAGGGSTITQQLAKNLFLSGSRSYIRKGQELVIAWMLEAVLDKRRILEIYLNVVEYGRGVFGAEAASRHYYRTSAARLNAQQAARLAVMLPNPRFYDRHRDTRYLNRRTHLIMTRMRFAQLP